MSAADDAVDQFLQAREALPKLCPSWCSGQHVQALEEGCMPEEAAIHHGPDFVVTSRSSNEGASIRTSLTAEHHTSLWRAPVVEVETTLGAGDDWRHVTVPLSSGEARVLARQLLHIADLVDLV